MQRNEADYGTPQPADDVIYAKVANGNRRLSDGSLPDLHTCAGSEESILRQRATHRGDTPLKSGTAASPALTKRHSVGSDRDRGLGDNKTSDLLSDFFRSKSFDLKNAKHGQLSEADYRDTSSGSVNLSDDPCVPESTNSVFTDASPPSEQLKHSGAELPDVVLQKNEPLDSVARVEIDAVVSGAQTEGGGPGHSGETGGQGAKTDAVASGTGASSVLSCGGSLDSSANAVTSLSERYPTVTTNSSSENVGQLQVPQSSWLWRHNVQSKLARPQSYQVSSPVIATNVTDVKLRSSVGTAHRTAFQKDGRAKSLFESLPVLGNKPQIPGLPSPDKALSKQATLEKVVPRKFAPTADRSRVDRAAKARSWCGPPPVAPPRTKRSPQKKPVDGSLCDTQDGVIRRRSIDSSFRKSLGYDSQSSGISNVSPTGKVVVPGLGLITDKPSNYNQQNTPTNAVTTESLNSPPTKQPAPNGFTTDCDSTPPSPSPTRPPRRTSRRKILDLSSPLPVTTAADDEVRKDLAHISGTPASSPAVRNHDITNGLTNESSCVDGVINSSQTASSKHLAAQDSIFLRNKNEDKKSVVAPNFKRHSHCDLSAVVPPRPPPRLKKRPKSFLGKENIALDGTDAPDQTSHQWNSFSGDLNLYENVFFPDSARKHSGSAHPEHSIEKVEKDIGENPEQSDPGKDAPTVINPEPVAIRDSANLTDTGDKNSGTSDPVTPQGLSSGTSLLPNPDVVYDSSFYESSFVHDESSNAAPLGTSENHQEQTDQSVTETESDLEAVIAENPDLDKMDAESRMKELEKLRAQFFKKKQQQQQGMSDVIAERNVAVLSVTGDTGGTSSKPLYVTPPIVTGTGKEKEDIATSAMESSSLYGIIKQKKQTGTSSQGTAGTVSSVQLESKPKTSKIILDLDDLPPTAAPPPPPTDFPVTPQPQPSRIVLDLDEIQYVPQIEQKALESNPVVPVTDLDSPQSSTVSPNWDLQRGEDSDDTDHEGGFQATFFPGGENTDASQPSDDPNDSGIVLIGYQRQNGGKEPGKSAGSTDLWKDSQVTSVDTTQRPSDISSEDEKLPALPTTPPPPPPGFGGLSAHPITVTTQVSGNAGGDNLLMRGQVSSDISRLRGEVEGRHDTGPASTLPRPHSLPLEPAPSSHPATARQALSVGDSFDRDTLFTELVGGDIIQSSLYTAARTTTLPPTSTRSSGTDAGPSMRDSQPRDSLAKSEPPDLVTDMDPLTGLRITGVSSPVEKARRFVESTESTMKVRKKDGDSGDPLSPDQIQISKELEMERAEILQRTRVRAKKMDTWMSTDQNQPSSYKESQYGNISGTEKSESERKYEERKKKMSEKKAVIVQQPPDVVPVQPKHPTLTAGRSYSFKTYHDV